MKSAARLSRKAAIATSGPASSTRKKPPTAVTIRAAMNEPLACQLQANRASPISQIRVVAMASARSSEFIGEA